MGNLEHLRRGPHFEFERLVPDAADPGNLSFSLRRYEFAQSYAVGRVVLDAGCGTGYGANLLAQVSSYLVAVDYDPKVILYAHQRYPSTNLAFATSTVTALPFNEATFDLVVNFEVIEHLVSLQAHELFLHEVRRVLKLGGLFIISTSNREVTVPHQNSVGIAVDAHLTEMDAVSFKTELEREFAVDFFGAMRYQGNMIYRFLRSLDTRNLRLRVPPLLREFLARTFFGVNRQVTSGSNVVIAPGQLRQADHFLAVCRKKTPA